MGRPAFYCPYDPDEIKGALDDAARIVAELELDDDLKLPAFQMAVQGLLLRQAEQPELPAILHGLALPGGPIQ